ncbi:MAG TPA: rRNA adenine N-6-methyltransferase family protein [Micromonosporaceae bacterium]|nr:rRNA adenine N-6-methyltransferase family protein [Micromonosporaceae bacterium]
MKFVREFVRNPRRTGSIAASSASVVDTVLQALDLTGARRVAELGAGTGALTRGLLRQLPEDARLLAVEANPSFCKELRHGFPGPRITVANRSAVELPQLTSEYQMSPLDAVVSALPWTLMSPLDRQITLDGVIETMAPNGQFVTLTCLHQTLLASGRRLREQLRERFGQVRSLPVVWAAVPPLLVYLCTRPRKPMMLDIVDPGHPGEPVKS